MKIYVINLKESTERRVRITRQLSELGLPFEIVDGVRGADLSEAERRAQYSDVRFRRKYGRTATNGEIGCSLSHVAVYRKVIAAKLPFALVLEDDAWLTPDLVQILTSLETTYRPSDKTLVLLSPVSAMSGSSFRPLTCGYVACPVRRAMLSHAYVVTAESAVALLHRLAPVNEVADAWTWLQRERVVAVEAVFPAIAIVQQAEGSAIRVASAPEPTKPRGALSISRIRAVWWRSWYSHGSRLRTAFRRAGLKEEALQQ